jgi:membrane-associated protease RseP (regulator of RpoE activity)
VQRLELVEEGVVEGVVVDGRGAPIAGARVAADHVPTWLVLGETPQGVVVTDARGRFVLRQLPEGSATLEAYMPEIGRSHVDGVRVVAGRTTPDVRIVLDTGPEVQDSPPAHDYQTGAGGSVAVTLGETGMPAEVFVVSVAEASEAERAGLLPGDAIVAVDDAPVHTMDEARARLGGPVSNDIVVRIRRVDAFLSLRVKREAVRR